MWDKVNMRFGLGLFILTRTQMSKTSCLTKPCLGFVSCVLPHFLKNMIKLKEMHKLSNPIFFEREDWI